MSTVVSEYNDRFNEFVCQENQYVRITVSAIDNSTMPTNSHITMEDARSLISAISPLYYISKLCGLAPAGIFSVLWSLLQLAFVSCGFVISLKHKMTHIYKSMASKAVVADVCTSVLLFGTAISSLFLGAMVNRKKLHELLNKMSGLDQRILRGRLAKTYKRMLIFVILEMLAGLLYMILIYTINFEAYGVELLAVIPEMVAHTINLVNVLQFVDVELLLKMRYLDINNQIPNKTPPPISKSNQIEHSNRILRVSNQNNRMWSISDQIKTASPRNRIWREQIPINRMKVAYSNNDLWTVDEATTQSLNKISDLRALREMHSDLYDIVEMVDFHFGFPILMELACNFVSLVSTLFTAMNFMKSTTQAKDPLYMPKFLDFLFWTILYLAKAGTIAISCHSASEEASRSISVVQKVLLEQSLAPSVSTELHLYLTQLCNNHVDFTACGFFSVNLSLLHAIIGATATYIIILIQLN